MPEQDPTSDATRRTLHEISHLFLSDVRDRHTGGTARPRRIPPDERAAGAAARPSVSPEGAPPTPIPPVTAVIGAHLGGGQFDRVRQYASHMAARVGRIGLIEVDADELRLLCYEAAADAGDGGRGDRFADGTGDCVCDGAGCDTRDPRDVAEAIEEMSADVRRWLVFVSQPRRPEGQTLLAGIGHWALLSTCDHDGVVSSYRMLKGLSDAPGARRPRLSLSLVDGDSEAEMVRVFRKLAGVSEQFLDWPVEPEPAVRPAPGVAGHPVLRFRTADGTGGGAGGPHWAVLTDFLARAQSPAAPTPAGSARPAAMNDAPVDAGPDEDAGLNEEAGTDERTGTATAADAPAVADRTPPPTYAAAPAPTGRAIAMGGARLVPAAPPTPAVATVAPGAGPVPAAAPMKLAGAPSDRAEAQATSAGESEVLDLSGPDVSVEAILDAILGRRDGGLVECPVRAPMCPSARLAIGRDRSVVLLAVAREGLSELRSIGRAYRWLVENRALIGMAVPQLAIDAGQAPRLRLLVDQADVSADVLQPMLHGGHVTVQAYRRVRWGGRSGLLLDAA